MDISMKQVADVARQATEQQPQSTGPGKAEAADKARFQEAMQPAQSGAETQQVAPAQQAAEAQQVAQVEQTADAQRAQGHKILDNLDKMSADYGKLREGILSGANGQGEMGDIIRLQMQVAEVTTTQTLVGKTGEKGGQGVNQLVRGQ